MTPNIYVFNQYFLTFIKSVKKSAKSVKDKNQNAREMLKTINLSYNTYDNKSNQYIESFNIIFTDFIMDPLVNCSNEEANEWILKNEHLNLLNNISIKQIKTILKKNVSLQQFLLIFYLFKNSDLTEQHIKSIIANLKGTSEENDYPEKYKLIVQKISEINILEKTGLSMDDIEDSSIGRLAKEIVEDVDIENIKKSINENGDILSALSDPDNGIGNLISEVTQKMASKLKNGEIKQDELLKDALGMAGKLPGFTGGGDNNNTPDIGNIMKMMSGMMGSGGGGGGGGTRVNKARNVQRKMEKLEKKQKKVK